MSVDNPWRELKHYIKPPRKEKACICVKRQPGREAHAQLAWRVDEGDGTWYWKCADGENAGCMYFDAWKYVQPFEGKEVQI